MLELLAGLRPGRILDVGCGPAVLASDLTGRGWSYVGIGASIRTINRCAARWGGRRQAIFGVADIGHLPFVGGTFDAVLCIGVIDRVAGPEAAITEMSRVLAPGGVLIMSFPNRLSPHAWWRARVFYPLVGRCKRLLRRLGVAIGHADETPGGALTVLKRHFAAATEPAFYGFVLLLSPLDELLPRLALRSVAMLEPLAKGRLRRLGSGFLIKAEKGA